MQSLRQLPAVSITHFPPNLAQNLQKTAPVGMQLQTASQLLISRRQFLRSVKPWPQNMYPEALNVMYVVFPFIVC